MRVGIALLSAVSAIAVTQAQADDLSISSKTTSGVSTSAAANSTAGNITITTAGSVEISAIGDAVKLDSNNTVTNNGTISNSIGTGARGVHILAGFTGGFTNAGTINVPGTGTPLTSSNQFGVLLDSTTSGATFTGNVTMLSGSKVTVSGLGATGLGIKSALVGDLGFAGTIEASGGNSAAVRISAPITGAIVNQGSLVTKSATSSTVTFNDTPTSAFATGSSVSGGILNAASGIISTTGSAPAVEIAPNVSGGLDALTIGAVKDTTNPNFGVLNRGQILAVGNQPTISTLALQVGDRPGTTSAQTTTITGGLFNSGTISATATSANTNATSLDPAATNATGLAIGVATSLTTLQNAASGTISAITTGPAGGTAIALSLATSANLPELNNSGVIRATALSTDTSITSLSTTAVLDQSGLLLNVTNSGVIAATSTPLDKGSQIAVALDLRNAISKTTVVNYGVIAGDIAYGFATTNVLAIDGTGHVVGRITNSGVGAVDISISPTGLGGTLQTSQVQRASKVTVGAGGTLNLSVGADQSILVTSTGDIKFLSGSRLRLTTDALPTNGSYRLLHSDTALTFENFSATTSTATLPFLFSGQFTSDSKNLTINIQRKSASQLGYTGTVAAIYEPAMAAALLDIPLGTAIAGVATANELATALEQMNPTISRAPRAIAASLVDVATNPVSARQRSLRLNDQTGSVFGVWALGSKRDLQDSAAGGHDGDAKSSVFGFDWGTPGSATFGLALNLANSDITETDSPSRTLSSDWTLISLYTTFGNRTFFVDGELDAGFAKLKGKRTIAIGSLSRTASTTDWSAVLAGGSLTAGYAADLGTFKVTPQVSLSAFSLQHSARGEKDGGNGINLKIEDNSEQSARAFAGVSIGDSYPIAGGIRIVPQILVGWGHEFFDSSDDLKASFQAKAGDSFIVPTRSGTSSAAVINAKLDIVVQGITMSVGYDRTFGSDVKSHAVTASLVAEF